MLPTRLTVTQAAEALGVDPSTLYRWCEQGLVTPSARLLGGPQRRGRFLFTPERVEEIRQQMTHSAQGVETP